MVGSRAPGPYTGTICSGGGLVRPTLGGVAGRPQWITAAANIALNNQIYYTLTYIYIYTVYFSVVLVDKKNNNSPRRMQWKYCFYEKCIWCNDRLVAILLLLLIGPTISPIPKIEIIYIIYLCTSTGLK